MKKTLIASLFLMVCFHFQVNAQKKGSDSYASAIGVKFFPGAVSFKQRFSKQNYLEAIAYSWKGTRLTALYELHYDIGGLDGLRWYVGPGVHLHFYNNQNFGGSSYMGIDGVIGLDYKIGNAPLNLTLDWQPSFDFRNNDSFNGGFGGLGVRYVLR